MISNVNGTGVKGSYVETSVKNKQDGKSVQTVTKQGDTSRIEELKASIEKGEYRVDIEALAQRIIQELT